MNTATSNTRFLRFVRFQDFFLWDYKTHFNQSRAEAKFPLVNLGEIIRAVRRVVRKEEYDGKIPIVKKITFADGTLELRDERKTGMNLFVAENGELVVSKINFHQGAVALNAAGRIACSTHYQPYAINGEIVTPDYLVLALRSKAVISGLDAIKSGGIKTELTADQICSFKIPLPALTEQKRIVAAHHAALGKADAADTRATGQQQGANRFLETTLGLKKETAKSKLASGILHFVRFATLERWGEFFTSSSADETGCKHPFVRLGDHVAGLQNGWSPKCLNRPANPVEWGVLKLGAVSFGKYDDTATKALPPYFQPKPEYEVKPGDVLISRGNALSLVGAAVYVTATRERLMLSDLIFRIVWKESSLVYPAYLAEVLRMPMLRHQIESVATGTSPSMKKITKPAVLNLRVPLPPVAEQRRIVARLDALRQLAHTAQTDAEQIRAAAKSSFEQALFVVAQN